MRMITLLMLAGYLVLTGSANAQYNTYAQANHYPFTSSTVTYNYLSGGTALPSSFNGDEQMVAIPIGFTFNFASVDNYNTVYASTNGWVSFKNVTYGGPAEAWYFDNTLPNFPKVTPTLMPFWDDMQGSTSGTASSASYRTTGTAPTRIFTLEYRNWRYWNASGPTISFQVILYENGGNNLIEYRYKQEPTAPAIDGATIGIARSTTDFSVVNGTIVSTNTFYTNNVRPANNRSFMWGLPVMINSLPADKLVCAGTNTTFTILSPNAISYQWQVFNGTTWADLSNGSSYSGVSSNTLMVINAQPFMNNYQYRCKLGYSGPGGVGVIATTPAKLNVNTQVSTQPSDKTVCEGVPAVYSCAASGIGLTYRWQVNNGSGFVDVSNGVEYSGATTNTLTVLNPVAAQNNYLYHCKISNSCGAPDAYTSDASLTVRTKPVITSPNMPDNLACTGTPSSFSITATGTDITYQWQEDGGSGFNNLSNSATYGGVTTNMLTIKNPALVMDGYRYRAVVTGACPSPATSNEPVLTVEKLTVITKDVVPGTTVCDSVQIVIGIKADGANLAYQWEESVSNGPFAAVPNLGSFSGANTDTLWITYPTSVLSGRIYRCRVDGTCGNIHTSNSQIIVNGLPHVTAQPADAVVEELKPTTFSIAATGTGIKYQWQSDNGKDEWQNLFNNYSYSGATTATLTVIGSYLDKDAFKYRCIVSGICGDGDTSETAELTVTPIPNSISGLSRDGSFATLYPNPVSGSEIMLKVSSAAAGDNFHVRVFDQLGRLINEEDVKMSADNTAAINISKMIPGVYTVQVTNADAQFIDNLRFTKQ